MSAGAAVGLYPLWNELVRLLIEEPVRRGVASDADRETWLRLAASSPQQVVRGVRRKLGSATYGEVLRGLFGYRAGADGRTFTQVQGALMLLPFRRYVTTNYDPGLLEARRVLRPDVRATGYATWRDHDMLRRWHTGDVFEDEHACPVFYAHGVFERSDTVVLGSASTETRAIRRGGVAPVHPRRRGSAGRGPRNR